MSRMESAAGNDARAVRLPAEFDKPTGLAALLRHHGVRVEFEPSDDLVPRTEAALEGITAGPWGHRTAPSNDSDETHAEWLTGTLIGEGEELHVLIAESPEPKFEYIVPAVTGDGPTSARNAEFIAAARTLVPELLDEVVKLRTRIEIIRCLSSANANASHVIGDVCREKAWLDILAVIDRESPRG